MNLPKHTVNIWLQRINMELKSGDTVIGEILLKDTAEEDTLIEDMVIEDTLRVMPMEKEQLDIFLADLEKYAREKHIPVVQPDTAELLKVIISIKNPRAVLEVGTAIGYSALMMTQLVSDDCLIDTIERNDDMVYKARENIKKAGFAGIINVIPGEAIDILECLAKAGKTYDFIFMDAAKGQYPDFFPFCYEMLEPGGVLVSDNVLYQGMVMGDEKLVRRKGTLVKRLRVYLDMLCSHPNLRTTVLPIGDGLALSYKVRV